MNPEAAVKMFLKTFCDDIMDHIRTRKHSVISCVYIGQKDLNQEIQEDTKIRT